MPPRPFGELARRACRYSRVDSLAQILPRSGIMAWAIVSIAGLPVCTSEVSIWRSIPAACRDIASSEKSSARDSCDSRRAIASQASPAVASAAGMAAPPWNSAVGLQPAASACAKTSPACGASTPRRASPWPARTAQRVPVSAFSSEIHPGGSSMRARTRLSSVLCTTSRTSTTSPTFNCPTTCAFTVSILVVTPACLMMVYLPGTSTSPASFGVCADLAAPSTCFESVANDNWPVLLMTDMARREAASPLLLARRALSLLMPMNLGTTR
mmetsp:Transcript_55370/g.154232  ORF Transcript_55370/g.154232 Transcript_55370/m.154232 type:complete len:270 (-) Transcript_55370:286-1095(-)